jgi:hypothetical protein
LKRTCSIEDCEKVHEGRGFCKKHYSEFIRRRDGVNPKVYRPKECIVDGCNKPHLGLNYCNSHYLRLKSVGGLKEDVPVRVRVYGRTDCAVKGCNRKHHSNGICKPHDTTRYTYSLSSEQLVVMLSRPCEVCGVEDNLTIDHNHSCCNKKSSCGKCVRGTVCQNCNRAMGQVKDSPKTLRMLADYLDRYSKAILL